MPTIYDIVKPKPIATYYNAMTKDRKPFIGETLFPISKKLGLDLKWIKGSKGLPIALKSSAFDAKSEFRDRIGFSDIQTEMPFFKESMLVKEKDRQDLNMVAGNPANKDYVDLITRNIFDDINNLIEGAEVQLERMRMQLLSEGKISIMTKDLEGSPKAMEYDYLLDNSQKISTDWTEVDADPIADIIKWQDSIEDNTGSRPTRAITTRKVWGYLLNNKKIQGELKALNQNNVALSNKMLENYMMEKLDLIVVLNNKKYKSEAGVTTNYFKEDVFTMLPDGELGKTWLGTTPEESDLMSGATDAEVSIVNQGIAITTTKQADPVNVNTKVSMIGLPSFERADEIVIATVKPTV